MVWYTSVVGALYFWGVQNNLFMALKYNNYNENTEKMVLFLSGVSRSENSSFIR